MNQIYIFILLIGLVCSTEIVHGANVRNLHLFSPWGTQPTLIRNSYGDEHKSISMSKDENHCGWYTYSAEGANDYKQVKFTNSADDSYGAGGEGSTAYISLMQDDGVTNGYYDSDEPLVDRFLVFNDDNTYTLHYERPAELSGKCKEVHIFSPWDTFAPIVVLPNDSRLYPTPDAENCGWHTLEIPHTGQFQTITLMNKEDEIYGKTGKDDSDGIDLSGILSTNTEVYLTLDATTSPSVTASRPKLDKPGHCLLTQLKGVIYDWDAYDFGAFQPGWDACNPDGIIKGLAADTLNSDNLPVPGPNASKCFAESITRWFTVEEGAAQGNRSCVDLQFSPNSEGIYEFNETVDIDDHSGEKGFYPLDTFPHENNSLKNGSELKDSKGRPLKHNYHFCMNIATSFTYKEGQHFEFEGDDDMWVYLNGSLVLDIGGIHKSIAGSLKIDDHLEPSDIGESQDFRIFYCERQTDQSNLKIQTDIDFDPPRYYHNELDSSSKNRQTNYYTIHEGHIQKSGGCSPDETSIKKESDFFWSTDTTISSDDIPLDAGESHLNKGIIIDNNQYQFAIDLLAIQEDSDIEEGTYYLIHRSQSTSSEEQSYVEVQVTNYDYFLQLVEPWSPKNELSSDPIEIGLLEQYDFAVKIFEVTKDDSGNDTILCESCEGSFSFEGSSLFDISNESYNEGLFQFSIFSDEPIKKEEITITFEPDVSTEFPHNKRVNSIETPQITVLDYPNFLPDKHGNRYIDTNSDGTMDRIELSFKTAPTDSVLENLDITFTWPNSDSVPLQPKAGELKPTDDPFVIYWNIPNKRYTIHPLLTHITDPAQESALIEYKHPKTGESRQHVIEMTDAMPPVLVSAELLRGIKGDLDTLIVQLTEPLEEKDLYKEGNKGYTATDRKGDNATLSSEANRISNETIPFTVHRIVFENNEDNSVAVGDHLTFYDHKDNIRDLEGNSPGDSALSVVVQSTTRQNLSIHDFFEITDDLLQNVSPEDTLTAIPMSRSGLDDENQAGLILGSNMKEVLWHFMDPYDWADNNPEHYSYHYTITVYNTLGNYINTHTGAVYCNNEDVFDGDCLESSSETAEAFALFIPPYAYNDRVLSTGVYIARATGYYRYTHDDTKIETSPFQTLFKLGVSRIEDTE
ncbi:MAG: fibro-slime domain-containing protein [Fibrobacterales bacterium]